MCLTCIENCGSNRWLELHCPITWSMADCTVSRYDTWQAVDRSRWLVSGNSGLPMLLVCWFSTDPCFNSGRELILHIEQCLYSESKCKSI